MKSGGKRERERNAFFFFFLIEKDIVIQCYLTAQLMLSEGVNHLPVPSVSLLNMRGAYSAFNSCVFRTAGVHFVISIYKVLMKY